MPILRNNQANTGSMHHCHPANMFNRNHQEHTCSPKTAAVPVDIHETDGSIMIYADMPGVHKKDISIDLEEGVLTISGTKEQEQDVTDKHYLKRERVSGSFKRAFTLTDRVNQDNIRASMENGVLTLEIPKSEQAKPRQIAID